MTAAQRVERFCVTTGTVGPGSSSTVARLTAEGALTELGGQLAHAAMASLLDFGVMRMTLDLSLLASVEEVGSDWPRRACLEVDGAAGSLWVLWLDDSYRASIPTSRPQLAPGDYDKPHSDTSTAAAPRTRDGRST